MIAQQPSLLLSQKRRSTRKRTKRSGKRKSAGLHTLAGVIATPIYAYCKVCKKELSCSEGGLKDIKRHGSTENHLRLAKSNVGQEKLTKVWSKEATVATQAARAEAILCNMIVEHNLPFLVMDHLPGLLRHAFPDSKIARR